MKKIMSCLLAAVLCLSASVTALADTVEFVPSISYKPAPEVVGTAPEGHTDCIIVTPVSKADTSEDISKEDAAELKMLYAELKKDGVKLSDECPDLNALVSGALGANKTANDLVVRDLFHVGANCDELDVYLDEGGTVKVTVKSTIGQDEKVFAMMWIDGAWQVIEAVNNQDGTITLAVNRRGKDEGTDFIDIVAWSKTAEFVNKYFTKGMQMAVRGRIQTRNWEDSNGNKRK